MHSDLPDADALHRYAVNPAYTLSCRETRVSWALGLALSRGNTELAAAYTKIQRELRQLGRPA